MRPSVLLVDDEPLVLRSLQRVLAPEPFELLVTSSPLEAMDLVRERGVDAVVADQAMPAMTGTKLLAWVHHTHPEVVRFMLTGHASLDVAIDAINEGAIHRFFRKPCDPIDLAYSLRQALQQKALFDKARNLYAQAKAQDALLADLERREPGITRVCRDESGAVVLEEPPTDVAALIDEMGSLAQRIASEGRGPRVP